MKLAFRILLILGALLMLLLLGGRAYLRRSVAPYSGTARVAVSAPVEITFDAKGIPQIWARRDADAFFALGFLHGSERLFQMELVRRLSRGELSEVFGKAAYETDVFQRQIGFARRVDASKLTPPARVALQRYVDGVNAAIDNARVLPPELVLLRLTPRRWTIEDCLAISNYQTWFSHALMDQDRRYQTLIEKLGMEAQVLSRAGNPWSPPTIPDQRITNASNSWVLAPSHSASRAALHAADPHLSIDQAPGLWYIAGLHSEEGLNIVGVTYGGAPFVVMGHNNDVAFSFTVGSIDLIDYYDDAPRGAAIREEIRVKGEDQPRVLLVRNGARGAMIDDRTSLHWAGFDFEPAALIDAALRLQKARDFETFRRGVTQFGALDANWIYSDRNGNIGYQLGAPVPIRDYDSYVRQNANDPKTVWRGYRALDATPHVTNPAQGFLASCNNNPLPANAPDAIPGFYDPYRIARATALLPAKRTVADMRAVQLDDVSQIALRWKSLAVRGARAAQLNGEAQLLERWDARMTPDSKAATLFEAWWRRLPRAIFEDELGADWETGRVLLDEALTTHTRAIDDRRTRQIETDVDVSARAMREAKDIARGRTWGEACTLLVKHPLSRVKVLDTLLHLNRGPFAWHGDASTLNANFFSLDEKSNGFRTHVGPSMRFVLDWANVDGFSIYGALGQSGNPYSPHYDDFLELARKGGEWNVPFTRARVDAKKTSTLTLLPSGDSAH
ncbi:MAG: penicillin acylase family protein [Acidobacteriota bacterium]|nr:penicillin acylase family protein [Acidobacteriota bacterium]